MAEATIRVVFNTKEIYQWLAEAWAAGYEAGGLDADEVWPDMRSTNPFTAFTDD